jgi:acyl transferase domain-containing protein
MNAPLMLTPTDRHTAQLSFDQRPWQLLLLSAQSAAALEQATTRLAQHIRANPALQLADIAFTLQVGRRLFEHRRMLLCHDLDDAVQALEQQPDGQVLTLPQCQHNPDVVFVFTEPSGRGYDVRPLQQLCAWNAFFHDQIEQCLQQLPAPLQGQLRRCLLPETPVPHPRLPAQAAQSAHFMAQYALARLWSSWGGPERALCFERLRKLLAIVHGT